jgi:hypothetical protein
MSSRYFPLPSIISRASALIGKSIASSTSYTHIRLAGGEIKGKLRSIPYLGDQAYNLLEPDIFIFLQPWPEVAV